MFVADTDVLVDFLRGLGAAGRMRIELQTGRLCTTAINAFELWAGARSPQEMSACETVLAATSILPVDPSSARRAGEIQRDLARAGAGIGMADALISGICLEHDAILLTRNRRHFERVRGLRLGFQ